MNLCKIVCRNCGHERNVTEAWLQYIFFSKVANGIDLNRENLKEEIHKFKCSKCGVKNAEYVNIEKEKNDNIDNTVTSIIKYKKKENIVYCDKSDKDKCCIDCGKIIPKERLDAKPNATRCVKCQSNIEKEKGFKRSIKENDGIAGSREDNKKMRARDWGDMRRRSRGE